ncbi:hypothetical protein G9A89_012914 [Geosiphon pyriformis]|nr:hypothetical protein G9A89_012914 [Geosiphon pyriformis]
MSFLEDEILALAGDIPRNLSPEPFPPVSTAKRKHTESESEEITSDQDLPKQDQNRIIAEERYDIAEPIGDEGEEFDDNASYASDLMGDEDDRERLHLMTEVERERILSERAERVFDLNLVTKRVDVGPKDGDLTRRSTRTKDVTKKDSKYYELKRAREEKGQKRAQSAIKITDISDLGERLSMLETTSISREYREKITGDELQFEDLRSIQITRRLIEKWMFSPFFKETVVGCFVRLYIGTKDKPIYRVCEIISVEKHHRNYKVENTLTNKSLRLKHGKAEKIWPMDIVSNSAFQQSEYDRWVSTMKHDNQRFPSKSDVEIRKKALSDAHEHVLTEQEVATIISQKKELKGQQITLVAEKQELVTKKFQAQSEGNLAEVEELAARIADIDSILNEQVRTSDERLHKWAQLNEKNRRKNLEDSREAEARAKEAKKRQKVAEESGKASGSESPGRKLKDSLVYQPSLIRLQALRNAQLLTSFPDDMSSMSMSALAESKKRTISEETIGSVIVPVHIRMDHEYEAEKHKIATEMRKIYDNASEKKLYHKIYPV